MSDARQRKPQHDDVGKPNHRALRTADSQTQLAELLGYLLSRPDDWKVLVNDLRKRGDLGRDGIYKVLRELREAGYVYFSLIVQ